ncbi:MAG: hypothetical protein RIF39_18630 [Cyclobacteriaceae bacterium]
MTEISIDTKLIIGAIWLYCLLQTSIVGTYPIWEDQFFDSGEKATFYRDLVAVFISLLLGIPSGIWVSRLTEQQKNKERKQFLLEETIESLEKNRGLLEEASRRINPQDDGIITIPTFSMDLVFLNAVSGVRHELITKKDILKKINHVHYELIHVDLRLAALRASKDTHGFAFERLGTIVLINGAMVECAETLDMLRTTLL